MYLLYVVQFQACIPVHELAQHICVTHPPATLLCSQSLTLVKLECSVSVVRNCIFERMADVILSAESQKGINSYEFAQMY